MRIVQVGAVYKSVIEKDLDTDKEEQYCTACKDERKDQKLIGMIILKDIKAKGGGFDGKEILDPFTGNTYRVKLALLELAKNYKLEGLWV